MAWPEGKLLVRPGRTLPIITNVSWFKMPAGRGTEKISFNTLENKAERMEALMSASHSFGAYTIKMVNNDKKMNASPNCVRLYCKRGNFDKLPFK